MTSEVQIVVLCYAIILFFVSLWRPKIGFFMLIPVIGIGFGDSSLIKGGCIGIVTFGAGLHALITGKRYTVPASALPFFGIALLFAAWILFRAVITGEDFIFWTAWIIKRIIAPGLGAFLAVMFIETKKDFLHAVWVLFGFGVITASAGIIQYISDTSWLWTLRESFGVPDAIAYQITDRVRITGLASYVIPFAYQLVTLFPIAIALLFVRRTRAPRFLFEFACAGIIFAALVLTFVKAGIMGAVIGGLIVALLLFRSQVLKTVPVVLMAVAIAGTFVFAVTNQRVSEKIFSIGDTVYERIPITIAAIEIAKDHPIGVGYAYSEHVQEVFSDISQYTGARSALVAFPHNAIMNLLVITGFPALVLAVGFFYILLRTLWRLSRSGDGVIHALSVGFLGSFVAYALNAMFHNNNPFFGDAFVWILIGVAISLIQIESVSRMQESENLLA